MGRISIATCAILSAVMPVLVQYQKWQEAVCINGVHVRSNLTSCQTVSSIPGSAKSEQNIRNSFRAHELEDLSHENPMFLHA